MHTGFRHLAALSCILSLALPARVVLASDGEVERTLVIVELRAGPNQDSLTMEYLREVEAGFKAENTGDFILLGAEKAADKLRKDRDQVPTALTDERRQQLAEARKKGIDYLDNADAPNAIKALQLAEARYRAALAAPGADEAMRKQYLDVLAQLATAHVVAKDKDAAADVFRTVIATFGMKANITDDNYRPDVVELFKAVVKEVKATKTGALEVTSTPAGARIILGGNDRGATPATVADVIPGNYSLRLQSGQATSLLHRVKIGGGAKTAIAIDVPFESRLVLDEKQVGLSYPDFDSASKHVQGDAVELGKQLEVNMVAVVGVIDGKLASFLVDVGKNETIRTAAVKVPNAAVSKRAVGRTMATILGEKADKGGEHPATPANAWYTSVPGWVCGGVGLIGLGIGGGMAATTGFGDVTVHTQADKDAIQRDRAIAITGLVAGTALLATSGVLFYLKGKSGAAGTDTAATVLPAGPVELPPANFGSAPVAFATR